MPPLDTPPERRSGRMGVAGILVATAIATTGTRMSAVAIPWLVLVTTGNPVSVGLVSGAEMLPYVLSSVFTAPLQDRFGSRRMAIAADLISMGSIAAIAAGHQISFILLLALVAIGGTLRAAGDRSRTTVLRPLIDQSGIGYPRITSAYEGIRRTAGLLGVSLGGVAIALLGAEGALWLNAVTFLASALVVAIIVPEPAAPPVRETAPAQKAPPVRETVAAQNEQPAESYWQSLRSGYRYFRRDRLLPNMTNMLFVTNLFNQASAVIFIPVWVLTVLHSPLTLGAVAGGFAAGAIVGNLVFTAVAPYLPRYPALVLGYMIGGMPRFLVLALSDNVGLVVAVMFISGFAMCSVNPTIGAVIYQRVPASMLSRANGFIAGAAYAGLPLGGIAGGLLVTRLGYTNGVLVAAMVYFAATLAPVVRPWVWREIDDVRRHPATSAVQVRMPMPMPVALARRALGLRVVLTYTDGAWNVQARRRLRRLVAQTPVEASAVRAGLDRLDRVAVRTTVGHALAVEHAETRRRALALRHRIAELSPAGLDAQ